MAAEFRPVSVAVLIPSRGRAALLAKTLARMPFLNDRHTFIGIEYREEAEYRPVLRGLKVTIVRYGNPEGSVGIAREALRHTATDIGYDWYVATDDNAKFTDHGLNALVQSAEARQRRSKKLTFMAGMHSTAAHFDRNLIKRKETVGGWDTYPGIGFIFHAIPHAWYANYSYPGGCFALEDRHMMLAAIDAGHREFRVCMGAPFSKSRYQPGGQGDINTRQWNCGRSIEQLAHDFPSMVGARGTLPLPWQFIIRLRDGATVDRLVGGAMRKGEVITRPKMMIKRTR
jgi:hypothetical protein